MKHPVVDHLWSKIVETGGLGLGASKSKLEQVQSIADKIRNAEGADVVRNVLEDGMIEQALKRCIEYHEGSSHLNLNDLHIYFRYARAAMQDAEKIIDDELSYLDL